MLFMPCKHWLPYTDPISQGAEVKDNIPVNILNREFSIPPLLWWSFGTLLCLKRGCCKTWWCKTKKTDWLKLLSGVATIKAHIAWCASPRISASQTERQLRCGARCLGSFIHVLLTFLSAKISSSYFFLECPESNVSKHKDCSWGLRSASKIPLRSMQVFVKLSLQPLGKTWKERKFNTSIQLIEQTCACPLLNSPGHHYQHLQKSSHVGSDNYIPIEDIYECIY